jgi:ABC-type glycerol-3-phosphate transport system substrate-binding protein
VFEELGLEVPKTQAELISTAKAIRQAKPDLYGLAVGGAYTYGAMPFIWSNGGEIAEGKGGSYASTIDGAAAQKGIKAYTSLFGDDNCPAAKCAGMGGNDTVTAFASGKAGMAIGGDFSHAAIEAGKVKGKYAVVPLPGVKSGEIAPAFAGGNKHFAPHARRRPDGAARLEEVAGRTLRRDGLPADVHGRTPGRREARAVRRALREDPRRGRQVRPGLARLVRDRRVPRPADDVPGGRQRA